MAHNGHSVLKPTLALVTGQLLAARPLADFFEGGPDRSVRIKSHSVRLTKYAPRSIPAIPLHHGFADHWLQYCKQRFEICITNTAFEVNVINRFRKPSKRLALDTPNPAEPEPKRV